MFLDEFDAIAKARDNQHELGELKRVINSLLQNIDQYAKNNILIAATNHEELLDKAIWRRFTSIISVNKPNQEVVEKIITICFGDRVPLFWKDSKKRSKALELFVNKTPADIQTVISSCIASNVINNKNEVELEDLLLELFYFENHNTNDDSVIKYLSNNGITQKTISELLGISLRQVRNYVKE